MSHASQYLVTLLVIVCVTCGRGDSGMPTAPQPNDNDQWSTAHVSMSSTIQADNSSPPVRTSPSKQSAITTTTAMSTHEANLEKTKNKSSKLPETPKMSLARHNRFINRTTSTNSKQTTKHAAKRTTNDVGDRKPPQVRSRSAHLDVATKNTNKQSSSPGIVTKLDVISTSTSATTTTTLFLGDPSTRSSASLKSSSVKSIFLQYQTSSTTATTTTGKHKRSTVNSDVSFETLASESEEENEKENVKKPKPQERQKKKHVHGFKEEEMFGEMFNGIIEKKLERVKKGCAEIENEVSRRKCYKRCGRDKVRELLENSDEELDSCVDEEVVVAECVRRECDSMDNCDPEKSPFAENEACEKHKEQCRKVCYSEASIDKKKQLTNN